MYLYMAIAEGIKPSSEKFGVSLALFLEHEQLYIILSKKMHIF